MVDKGYFIEVALLECNALLFGLADCFVAAVV